MQEDGNRQLSRYQIYYRKHRTEILERESVKRLTLERKNYLKRYLATYLKKPDVIEKRKLAQQKESYKRWKSEWTKKYELLPEVKARHKRWRQSQAGRIYQNKKNSMYQQTPEYKEYMKTYYSRNREKILTKNKQHYKEKPGIYLKSRMKFLQKLTKPFNFTTAELRMALINWADVIMKRDRVCQICGNSNKLESHHILYKKYYPKLCLNPNNGILLCFQCHRETHGQKIGGGDFSPSNSS